jgi:hypothetical protein
VEIVVARRGKLTPNAVRAISKSPESAVATARRFKVSGQFDYLIRAGRIHKAITARLTAPVRKGRRQITPRTGIKFDINALADAILDRLVKRLRGR